MFTKKRLITTITKACSIAAMTVLSWNLGLSVRAAEKLTIQVGPFSQAIQISDLDHFAKTGKLPSDLQLYEPLLTPQLREVLKNHINVDPTLGNTVVKDLLRSPAGETLVKRLGIAIPNSTVEQVQGAISLAIRQTNDLSLISFLKAYPDRNVTVDASSVVELALQFNIPHWQSQAISSLLEKELAIEKPHFHAAFDPSIKGNRKVYQKILNFTDNTRKRQIAANVYWSKNTQGQLIVISHGFGADRLSLDYLAQHLASYGFTVAAIEHPGSNAKRIYNQQKDKNFGTLLEASEFINRPKDISFLLDRLAKINHQPGILQNKLNTEQVSVIGHSLGGYTALAVAGGELNFKELREFCKDRNFLGKAGGDWLQCVAIKLPNNRVQLRDKRVVQVIALNPLIGQLFGKEGLSKISIPTLMLTSTGDALTPALSHQLQPFMQLQGQKYLITAIGATHLSVTDPGNFSPTKSQLTLINEQTGKEAAPLRKLLQGVSLAFLKQLTPEAKIYSPFLTSAYAQSLSTSAMPLRLNAKLPTSVTSWFGLASITEF